MILSFHRMFTVKTGNLSETVHAGMPVSAECCCAQMSAHAGMAAAFGLYLSVRGVYSLSDSAITAGIAQKTPGENQISPGAETVRKATGAQSWSGSQAAVRPAQFCEGGMDKIRPVLYLWISRLLPVISFGCSIPIISIMVGMMSHRAPPSSSVYSGS